MAPYRALVQPMGHWECSNCGQDIELGSKRSLWSLLPFVCDHRAIDYTAIKDEITDHGKYPELILSYEQRDVYRKPIPCRESTLKTRLRDRLADSLKDRRLAWWLPLWSEHRDEARQRKAARGKRYGYSLTIGNVKPEGAREVGETEHRHEEFYKAGERGFQVIKDNLKQAGHPALADQVWDNGRLVSPEGSTVRSRAVEGIISDEGTPSHQA